MMCDVLYLPILCIFVHRLIYHFEIVKLCSKFLAALRHHVERKRLFVQMMYCVSSVSQ